MLVRLGALAGQMSESSAQVQVASPSTVASSDDELPPGTHPLWSPNPLAKSMGGVQPEHSSPVPRLNLLTLGSSLQKELDSAASAMPSAETLNLLRNDALGVLAALEAAWLQAKTAMLGSPQDSKLGPEWAASLAAEPWPGYSAEQLATEVEARQRLEGAVEASMELAAQQVARLAQQVQTRRTDSRRGSVRHSPGQRLLEPERRLLEASSPASELEGGELVDEHEPDRLEALGQGMVERSLSTSPNRRDEAQERQRAEASQQERRREEEARRKRLRDAALQGARLSGEEDPASALGSALQAEVARRRRRRGAAEGPPTGMMAPLMEPAGEQQTDEAEEQRRQQQEAEDRLRERARKVSPTLSKAPRPLDVPFTSVHPCSQMQEERVALRRQEEETRALEGKIREEARRDEAKREEERRVASGGSARPTTPALGKRPPAAAKGGYYDEQGFFQHGGAPLHDQQQQASLAASLKARVDGTLDTPPWMHDPMDAEYEARFSEAAPLGPWTLLSSYPHLGLSSFDCHAEYYSDVDC